MNTKKYLLPEFKELPHTYYQGHLIMPPIDDDILQSYYGDDPQAADWYRRARQLGDAPDAAMRTVDALCQGRQSNAPLTPEQLDQLLCEAEQIAELITRLIVPYSHRSSTDT